MPVTTIEEAAAVVATNRQAAVDAIATALAQLTDSGNAIQAQQISLEADGSAQGMALYAECQRALDWIERASVAVRSQPELQA